MLFPRNKISNIKWLLFELAAHAVDVDALAELEERLGSGDLEDEYSVASDYEHATDQTTDYKYYRQVEGEY